MCFIPHTSTLWAELAAFRSRKLDFLVLPLRKDRISPFVAVSASCDFIKRGTALSGRIGFVDPLFFLPFSPTIYLCCSLPSTSMDNDIAVKDDSKKFPQAAVREHAFSEEDIRRNVGHSVSYSMAIIVDLTPIY